jgi:nitrogen fixation protein FixH
MIKLAVFAGMLCFVLFNKSIANAQVYNQSASSRQTASADLGMYQITLAAFQASKFYAGRTDFSQKVVSRVSKTAFGDEGCITVDGAGFPYPARDANGTEVKTYSYWVRKELRDSAYSQRDIYLSLSAIAKDSFETIKKRNMSRAQAVAFMTNQIDSQLEPLIIANDYVGGVRINTNARPGEYSQCLGDQKFPNGPINSREALGNKYPIEYTLSTSGGGKATNDFIREYTAVFADGTVIKANNGNIDLFYRGQPWFADNGIQGQKLSIGSSSENGSNTTQKRGE